MKVLLIHTFYQKSGGEDTVFYNEYNLLKEQVDIRVLIFKNKNGILGALQFILYIFNIFAGIKILKEIKRYNPDLIHIHNIHFALGPIVFVIAKFFNKPTLLTLHNYRLICPSGTLFYNNTIHTESINQSFPWTAILNKAYRNSFILTFWLATVIWIHKIFGTWKTISKYIALTDSYKEVILKSKFGLACEQVVVKPNFTIQTSTEINLDREDHFLYIGRLSNEKGVLTLIEAFSKSKFKLKIAGSGPLEEKVVSLIQDFDKIIFLGNLSNEDVNKELKTCSALIFPSIWYEGMPMTILEAFSNGTPVIASNIGAMASMVEHKFNGLHFEAGNYISLLEKINIWHKLQYNDKLEYYYNAFTSYNRKYSPELNRQFLISIYKSVINEKASS
ncbi:glycosyltransferase family 4 protein [Telluribacter sp. SYSU D00476]|uniref:glycosyltransferase family 4 protein n=1 Tax=Telluribacter sp. SYSU D00476 TaxID=2811430 RepID=UPI001FF5363E|nr:glycosyltransferase family 4 protein [Telluribacter sp. SYSU D00476]